MVLVGGYLYIFSLFLFLSLLYSFIFLPFFLALFFFLFSLFRIRSMKSWGGILRVRGQVCLWTVRRVQIERTASFSPGLADAVLEGDSAFFDQILGLSWLEDV